MTRWTARPADGVINVHRREVPGDLVTSRRLLATLATREDLVWPRDRWPRIWFGEEGITVGAAGGHGPIRYSVTESGPDRVAFQFAPPMTGGHSLEIAETPGGITWTHTLSLHRPKLVLTQVVLPLHDACLEDLLDQVEAATANRPLVRRRFPVGVRLRRWLMGRLPRT